MSDDNQDEPVCVWHPSDGSNRWPDDVVNAHHGAWKAFRESESVRIGDVWAAFRQGFATGMTGIVSPGEPAKPLPAQRKVG